VLVEIDSLGLTPEELIAGHSRPRGH
jgi:hypothetical protein